MIIFPFYRRNLTNDNGRVYKEIGTILQWKSNEISMLNQNTLIDLLDFRNTSQSFSRGCYPLSAIIRCREAPDTRVSSIIIPIAQPRRAVTLLIGMKRHSSSVAIFTLSLGPFNLLTPLSKRIL